MNNAESSTTTLHDRAGQFIDQGEVQQAEHRPAVGYYGPPGEIYESPPQEAGGVSGVERWLLRRLLSGMGDPPVHIVLWNGEILTTSREAPVARILFKKRRALFKVLRDPALNFGHAYTDGDVEIEGDLIGLLEVGYMKGSDLDKDGLIPRRLLAWLNRPRHRSLRLARENIHHHYDIGNDFYRLWLDDEMVYTCAYYPSVGASLEQAQQAKMHYICRKLRLRRGETVVEAGCGWGSLARFMARHYGVKVKAFNISREQVAYARDRARREGLEDRVEFIEEDYREIQGSFDVFVSVGMLEHVGREHYSELGEVVHRSLHGAGRGLIHSIGRNKPCPMNTWIEKCIFPGAYPPSLREMTQILEPWEFSVSDIENLRLHYARTLMDWLERYEQRFDQITQMYDEPFARAWRLYLAGSIAAFTAGSLQLFQIVFARPDVNDLPWTRAYLYDK